MREKEQFLMSIQCHGAYTRRWVCKYMSRCATRNQSPVAETCTDFYN